MAWRPTEYLIEGMLDNTKAGKVTGWMRFAGMTDAVMFDLAGNFHRDIRGTKIRLRGEGKTANQDQAREYMSGLSLQQTGKVGDITAGRPPQDYVDYPYVEWYTDANGRCVLELTRPGEMEVIGEQIVSENAAPISRDQQKQNMTEFLNNVMQAFESGRPKVRRKGKKTE